MIFEDRKQGGSLLVPQLTSYNSKPKTIVLGLARGGVVVAAEVAKGLHLPLNVLCPRKIGAPGNPELAIGAIMEDGEGIFNEDLMRILDVSEGYLERETAKERERATQRLALFRKNHPLPNLEGYTVLLVDDGIATGATMQAAIKWLKTQGVIKIVVASPVAALESLETIKAEVDEVVCLHHPYDFGAVGYFYEQFDQTEDNEVVELLNRVTV